MGDTPVKQTLKRCFTGAVNQPGKKPKAIQYAPSPRARSFEQRAFLTLHRNMKELGIRSLHKCSACRMDGYLVTSDGQIVLLEMKESLRWGSTQSATFQFLAGRKLLRLKATHGLIVFERFSREWSKAKPHGAWGQLALHAAEVSKYIKLGGLRIGKRGRISGPPRVAKLGAAASRDT